MTSTQRMAMRYTKNMFDDFKKYAPEQAYTFLSDFTPDDVTPQGDMGRTDISDKTV